MSVRGSAGSAPEISFVIPAVNELSDLQKSVRALQGEQERHEVEIVVVSRLGEAFDERVRRELPGVRLLTVPADTPIPQMRARGLEQTRAARVAIIEDHVQVPPGWVQRALAESSEREVVAGPVSNVATSTLVDRVAFLCEYSHCLPPVPGGPSSWLPGNSVVYPAAVVKQHLAILRDGGWENELHAAVRGEGIGLRFVPELEVGHDKHYSIAEYTGQRYLYARSYAGNRVRARGFVSRLVHAGAAVLLPVILLARIGRRVMRRPGYRSTFFSGLPLLFLFVSSWAVGEVIGYALGPGRALSRVR